MTDESWGSYYDDSVTGLHILDRVTGVIHTATGQYTRFSEYWWREGNGSCDCNRKGACGLAVEVHGTCDGCVRFVIVHPDGTPRAGWNDDGYDLTGLPEPK